VAQGAVTKSLRGLGHSESREVEQRFRVSYFIVAEVTASYGNAFAQQAADGGVFTWPLK
jgi:hypothetical protein